MHLEIASISINYSNRNIDFQFGSHVGWNYLNYRMNLIFLGGKPMKRLRSLLLFTLIFTTVARSAQAYETKRHPKREWTFLVYFEGRNNLNSFAKKNIRSMIKVGSSARVNVLVQWFQPGQDGFRYRIEKNRLVSCGAVDAKPKGNHKNNIVEAMRWAVKTHPAEKYAFILWNHGLGFVDPTWNPNQLLWGTGAGGTVLESRQQRRGSAIDAEHIEALNDNPRTSIAGITTTQNEKELLEDAVSGLTRDEVESLLDDSQDRISCEHRGILFNEYDRTYLNNQDLVAALKKIKYEILKGKNLDILGMDACLMSMLSVAYQVKDYADHFVASEEVELAQGWSYDKILEFLVRGSVTPRELSAEIVRTFEEFFAKRTYLYTLTALELKKIDTVALSLNAVLTEIDKCFVRHTSKTMQSIRNARRYCVEYTTPSFIDLHSFYEELSKQLKKVDSGQYQRLLNLIDVGQKMIRATVYANVNGPYLTKSGGISIYYPRRGIDKSFVLTEFGKKTKWAKFLRKMQGRQK